MQQRTFMKLITNISSEWYLQCKKGAVLINTQQELELGEPNSPISLFEKTKIEPKTKHQLFLEQLQIGAICLRFGKLHLVVGQARCRSPPAPVAFALPADLDAPPSGSSMVQWSGSLTNRDPSAWVWTGFCPFEMQYSMSIAWNCVLLLCGESSPSSFASFASSGPEPAELVRRIEVNGTFAGGISICTGGLKDKAVLFQGIERPLPCSSVANVFAIGVPGGRTSAANAKEWNQRRG